MPEIYKETRRAPSFSELRSSTWDEGAGTVEVVFSTGARARRVDSWTGKPFIEELEMTPGAVRLERLNSGAPVLLCHATDRLSDQVGIIVPGSARIEPGGIGVATLQLSQRPELASLRADIAAGIYRNVSVGYAVHSFEIEERDGEQPLYRVTDWEPIEISFVPIPADAAAQVRAAKISLTGETTMEEEIAARSRGSKANETRVATARFILERAQSAGLSNESAAELLDAHATRRLTEEEVWGEVGQRFAARDQARGQHRGGSGRVVLDDDLSRTDALADALYCRMANSRPTEAGRAYAGMSFADLAREALDFRGDDVRRMSVGEVVHRAMHTNSDFPNVLGSAFNRYLLEQYQAAETPLKKIARKRLATDFRELYGVRLEGESQLSRLTEGGEIRRGSLVDSGERYRVSTFAKIFAVSREAIINDDVNAFSDMLRLLARASAETEAGLLVDLLTANAGAGIKLSDGQALFGAARGNKASTGTAIDIAALSAGRKALRDQKNPDGSPINAVSRYILTGSAKETEAESVVAKLLPSSVTDVNPFAERLEVLVDPRLPGGAWWLFADPAFFPVLEYAYLNGNEGPQIETREGWDSLGTEWRVVLDFGCGGIGWRGSYLNEGN